MFSGARRDLSVYTFFLAVAIVFTQHYLPPADTLKLCGGTRWLAAVGGIVAGAHHRSFLFREHEEALVNVGLVEIPLVTIIITL